MKGGSAVRAGQPRLGGAVSGRARPSIAGVVAAVWVVLLAVVADPWGLAPFGPAKWAVASCGVLAVTATLATRRRLSVANVPTLVLLALVLWAAVTATAGLDPLYAWIGTPERHWGVVAWALFLLAFVTGQAVRSSDVRTVATGVAAAAGLVGIWSVAELIGWQPFDLAGGSGRPGGPFGSSAYLGAFAVLTLPMAVAVALDRSARRSVRVAAAVASGLGATALAGAGARAAWGGALVAAMAWVACRHPVERRRALLAGVAAAAVLVALAVATGAADRAPALVADERGGVRGRVDEWRVAARVVADHPLLGVGPEGYRIAFGGEVDEAYEQAHGRHPLPDRAHSAVLDVAATLGVPGAVAYVGLLALLVSFALRAIRHGGRSVAAAAVGVVGYFAQSLVLFPVPELDVVAWLLAGVVVGATARDRERRVVHVPRVVPAGVAVIGVIALVAGGLDVAADRAAARALDGAADADRPMRLRPDALRYRLVAARGHESSGSVAGLDSALDRLRGAGRLSPADPVVGAEVGRVLLDRARRTGVPSHIEEARAHLEALVRSDRRNAEAQLRLGLARALDGDDGGAEAAWLAAERLAPRSAAASTNLALAYARLGRPDEARAAARRALERDPASSRAHDVLRVIDGT